MASGLGALTLSPTAIGFNPKGTAMVPVTAGGGQKLGTISIKSPMESMQEVFYDIRDGIYNLAESINNQTGLLNSTLFGVIHTLSNIGNIAAKDLDIETAAAKEAAENEAQRERDEALAKDPKKEKGPGMLAGLKTAFGDLIDKFTPKSETMKVGLMGLLTLGLFTQLDKIKFVIEKVYVWLDEKVIPAAKRFWEAIKDDFGPAWEGIVSWFTLLTGGISDIWEGFKTDDPVLKLKGLKKLFFDLPIKFVAVVGDALFGLTDAVLQMFGIDAKWVKDIQIAFRTLPEAIDKAITDTIKFFTDGWDKLKEVYNEEGLIGAVGEGFRMYWDNVVAKAYEIIGWLTGALLKFVGAKKMGEALQNLDLSWDGITNAVGIVVDKIKGVFDKLINGMKGMANSIIDKANKWLPDWAQIKKLDITETMVESADGTTSLPLKEVKTVAVDVVPAGSLQEKVVQKFNETYVDKIVKQSNIMKEKETELKTAVAAKGDTTPGNVTIMTDAKRITGDTVNTTQVTASNQRVDHTDKTAEAILNMLHTRGYG